jgi:cellulose synthase/poly-beta-1,6-N-acetylglucosamine synthase-like glycosyltransferase
MIVTDGSDDHSEEIIRNYPDVIYLHQPVRRGKMAAINRAMPRVDTEVVIFSDANAILNPEAARELIRFFSAPDVGCVCGEKRLLTENTNDAASAGEGTYWRYESTIKAAEASLGSCVGAVGELFAIRTSLFRAPPDDTLLDDFVLSMNIALQGYRVLYTPNAYAMESSSANIQE